MSYLYLHLCRVTQFGNVTLRNMRHAIVSTSPILRANKNSSITNWVLRLKTLIYFYTIGIDLSVWNIVSVATKLDSVPAGVRGLIKMSFFLLFFSITVLGLKVKTVRSLQKSIGELVPWQAWKWTLRNHYRYWITSFIKKEEINLSPKDLNGINGIRAFDLMCDELFKRAAQGVGN